MNILSFVILFSYFLSSCSSYTDDTKVIRSEFRFGSYQNALNVLDKSDLKESQKNRLLYLLERSSILDRLGRLKKSRKMLLDADKLVDELYTTSISKEAATYILNESAQDYPGEDYEKVAIHTMLAMSFLKEGNLSAARVEARKINSRLNEINASYKKKNQYQEDAFGRYLAGLIYEARGEWDDAIIDYKKALQTYENDYRRYFRTSPPRNLVQSLANLLNYRSRTTELRKLRKSYPWVRAQNNQHRFGEVLVIHQLGAIAIKQRNEFVIPFGKDILRFSFPIIRPKSSYNFGRTGIRLAGRPFQKAAIVQNMDEIAAQTLEDRRGRLLAKAGARLILKSQVRQNVEKQFGGLAGLLVNVAGAVTETADTRQWSLLPSVYSITRIRLGTGRHDLKIYSDGKLSKIKTVDIKPGKMTFLVVD